MGQTGSKQNSKPLSPSPSSQQQIKPMEKSQIRTIEKLLGFKFKNMKLVEEALTHPSFYYPAEAGLTFDRLEYLGNAVLNVIVAKELYKRYPDLPPGPLTRLRAANVDKEKLARIAVGCGLHKFLRHNAPQLEGQINMFIKEMDQYPIHSNGLLDPPKALGDAVESLLGAVFVDSNDSYDTVWKIFKKLSKPLITLDKLGKHPMTELNEFCQKTHRILRIDQDNWDKDLTVKVFVNDKLMGSAEYGLKKDVCQSRAAKAALIRLISETQNIENTARAPHYKSFSLSSLSLKIVSLTQISHHNILSILEKLKPGPKPRKITNMDGFQIGTIERILAYGFKNRKLAEDSMSHPSFYYPVESDLAYERLEFLGDAVINACVAVELFHRYPGMAPGMLTRLRAVNVDKEKLVRTAVGCGLHQFLRHNSPQLNRQIDAFVEEMDQYPVHSNGMLDPPKALGDAIESLMGAVFVDSNGSHEKVWKVYKRLAEPLITPHTLGKHPMTELNELCQKMGVRLKLSHDSWKDDPTVKVFVDGKLVGAARYAPKKDVCQNRAAKVALNRLKEMFIAETKSLESQTC